MVRFRLQTNSVEGGEVRLQNPQIVTAHLSTQRLFENSSVRNGRNSQPLGGVFRDQIRNKAFNEVLHADFGANDEAQEKVSLYFRFLFDRSFASIRITFTESRDGDFI